MWTYNLHAKRRNSFDSAPYVEARLLTNADGINQRCGAVNRITTVIRRKRKRYNLPSQRGDASHGTLLPSGRCPSAHTDIQLNYKCIIYPLVFCVKNENENGALDGILTSPTRGSSRISPSGRRGPTSRRDGLARAPWSQRRGRPSGLPRAALAAPASSGRSRGRQRPWPVSPARVSTRRAALAMQVVSRQFHR